MQVPNNYTACGGFRAAPPPDRADKGPGGPEALSQESAGPTLAETPAPTPTPTPPTPQRDIHALSDTYTGGTIICALQHPPESRYRADTHAGPSSTAAGQPARSGPYRSQSHRPQIGVFCLVLIHGFSERARGLYRISGRFLGYRDAKCCIYMNTKRLPWALNHQSGPPTVRDNTAAWPCPSSPRRA